MMAECVCDEYIRMNCVCTPQSDGLVNRPMEEVKETTYCFSICVPTRCLEATTLELDCSCESCCVDIKPIKSEQSSDSDCPTSLIHNPTQLSNCVSSKEISSQLEECRPLSKLRSGRAPQNIGTCDAFEQCYPTAGKTSKSYLGQRNPKCAEPNPEHFDKLNRKQSQTFSRFSPDIYKRNRNPREAYTCTPQTEMRCPSQQCCRSSPLCCASSQSTCPPISMNCTIAYAPNSPIVYPTASLCLPQPCNPCQPRGFPREKCCLQGRRHHCF